jgi:PTS system fructose-specific IIC component
MSKILALTACTSGTAHSVMAAEALKKQAALLGHEIEARVVDPGAGTSACADGAVMMAADGVVLATDTPLDLGPLGARRMHVTSTASAIRDPAGAIQAALALGRTASTASKTAEPAPAISDAAAPTPAVGPAAPSPAVAPPGSADRPVTTPGSGKRLVAITACPTGIAHTFMAAEALKRQASAMGHDIAVETQGSVGAKNVLTDEMGYSAHGAGT